MKCRVLCRALILPLQRNTGSRSKPCRIFKAAHQYKFPAAFSESRNSVGKKPVLLIMSYIRIQQLLQSRHAFFPVLLRNGNNHRFRRMLAQEGKALCQHTIKIHFGGIRHSPGQAVGKAVHQLKPLSSFRAFYCHSDVKKTKTGIQLCLHTHCLTAEQKRDLCELRGAGMRPRKIDLIQGNIIRNGAHPFSIFRHAV